MDANTANQGLAVLGLVACAAVWGGMALGPARRHQLQGQARRLWLKLQRRLRGPGQARRAREEADAAIARAKQAPKVDREGNVYRPDRFRQGGDGRDKLH